MRIVPSGTVRLVLLLAVAATFSCTVTLIRFEVPDSVLAGSVFEITVAGLGTGSLVTEAAG